MPERQSESPFDGGDHEIDDDLLFVHIREWVRNNYRGWSEEAIEIEAQALMQSEHFGGLFRKVEEQDREHRQESPSDPPRKRWWEI